MTFITLLGSNLLLNLMNVEIFGWTYGITDRASLNLL